MSARRPAWSRWNPAAARRPWTVGLEEEVMLLEPRGWTLAGRIDDVLASLPASLASQTSAETHACVIELATRPHATAGAAGAELCALRAALDGVLRGLGLRAAVAGTHPSAAWNDVDVSSGARYRKIAATMRALARREPTFALHVHVAVPDGETGVRALDGLRADLPLLLALSAGSPYWQGRDSGLASARTPIFSMFPRVGIPRRFGSYATYVTAVDTLVRSGAIPDPTFLWWDARLQPRFGTLEVRVMDAQTRADDAAALAALVQCLVRLNAERDPPYRAIPPEVLDENRFLASRDGMHGRLIDARSGRLRPAGEQLAERLAACQAVARDLAAAEQLAGAAALAADPGADRQRRLAAGQGLRRLVAALSAEFTAGGASLRPPGSPASGDAPAAPRA
jgi:carboxylate-amine ligase